MCAELLLFLHHFFSISLFSNIVQITWKYISFQNVTDKGNLVSGYHLQILREEGGGEGVWCLMANLVVYNWIVNIIFEAVTLKPLLRWVLNMGRLCLATKENCCPWELWKVVISFNFVKNGFFSEKFQKSTLGSYLHVLVHHHEVHPK